MYRAKDIHDSETANSSRNSKGSCGPNENNFAGYGVHVDVYRFHPKVSNIGNQSPQYQLSPPLMVAGFLICSVVSTLCVLPKKSLECSKDFMCVYACAFYVSVQTMRNDSERSLTCSYMERSIFKGPISPYLKDPLMKCRIYFCWNQSIHLPVSIKSQ